jgi:hypothetical protein
MFTDEETANSRLEGDRNVLGPSYKPATVIDLPDPDSLLNERKEDDDSKIVLPCLEGESALKNLEEIIVRGGLDRRSHYVGDREAQKAIGETDALLGPSITSRIFGNTPPQAQSYGDGLQTPSHKLNKQIKEVREHVDIVKLSIARAASLKLKKIVDCINEERIEQIGSPVILARLGKDVAAIVDRVSPRDVHEEDRSIFHIYKPEVASHDEYNIVNISVAPPIPHRIEDDKSVIDILGHGNPAQTTESHS